MKKSKSLVWQIFKSFVIIFLISFFAITIYMVSSLHQFYYDNVSSELIIKTKLISQLIQRSYLPLRQKPIDELCKELGKISNMRITIILPSGKVLGDSEKTPGMIDNHSNRIEIKKAISGETFKTLRYSNTLQKKLMYVSYPLVNNHETICIIRTSIPVKFIDIVIKEKLIGIIFIGLSITFIVALISYFVSRFICKPLEELEYGLKCFADGNLKFRFPTSKIIEVDKVSKALNNMAFQLEEKINTIIRQNNEQKVMFSSMAEGIIAVNRNGEIIKINRSALKFLGVKDSEIECSNIRDIVKNKQLKHLILHNLSNKESFEDEIKVKDKKNRILFVRGTMLNDSNKDNIGAVIVINNVTQLRHLEKIRKDFVANVSHELKTPITTIKGFVETLTDGAINESERALHFLNIISRHVNRLEAITEDLLELSSLEEQSNETRITFEEKNIKSVLEAAVDSCEINAKKKNITISLECDSTLKAKLNASLMEQALINLIDNAIKFSNEGSSVIVQGEKRINEVIINVIDQGCGIAEKHLPRLFERFYRTDKARSRKLGGTGLGLAIVKHIVQIHNGIVSVSSEKGIGSTFSINIPDV